MNLMRIWLVLAAMLVGIGLVVAKAEPRPITITIVDELGSHSYGLDELDTASIGLVDVGDRGLRLVITGAAHPKAIRMRVLFQPQFTEDEKAKPIPGAPEIAGAWRVTGSDSRYTQADLSTVPDDVFLQFSAWADASARGSLDREMTFPTALEIEIDGQIQARIAVWVGC